jgi:F-type H+-transporting ATPase subunit beta
LKGKQVSLSDALGGCERILRDEFKDVPESALYMIGAIGEVKQAPPQAKQQGKAGPAAVPPPVIKEPAHAT